MTLPLYRMRQKAREEPGNEASIHSNKLTVYDDEKRFLRLMLDRYIGRVIGIPSELFNLPV